MSVIWSGITEEGAVVPVQVEESGKVVAQGYPGEKGDKGDPGKEGPEGPPGEYSKGDDVELNDAFFTGRVGIGTDDPSTALHISGDGVVNSRLTVTRAGVNGAVGIVGNNLLLTGLGSDGTDGGTVFYNGGNESVRILSDGRVGIGMDEPQALLDVDGDVILKSRNKKWMIVEQSGLAHLVEQSVFLRLNPHLIVSDVESDAGYDPKPDTDPVLESIETIYPELRNIPGELTLVEQALGEVFEKLRMSPPAGWPVWDGQSEVATDNDNA